MLPGEEILVLSTIWFLSWCDGEGSTPKAFSSGNLLVNTLGLRGVYIADFLPWSCWPVWSESVGRGVDAFCPGDKVGFPSILAMKERGGEDE